MKPEPPTRTYPLKEELHLGHTCKGVLEDGKKFLKVENRQGKTFVWSLGRRNQLTPSDAYFRLFCLMCHEMSHQQIQYSRVILTATKKKLERGPLKISLAARLLKTSTLASIVMAS